MIYLAFSTEEDYANVDAINKDIKERRQKNAVHNQ